MPGVTSGSRRCRAAHSHRASLSEAALQPLGWHLRGASAKRRRRSRALLPVKSYIPATTTWMASAPQGGCRRVTSRDGRFGTRATMRGSGVGCRIGLAASPSRPNARHSHYDPPGAQRARLRHQERDRAVQRWRIGALPRAEPRSAGSANPRQRADARARAAIEAWLAEQADRRWGRECANSNPGRIKSGTAALRFWDGPGTLSLVYNYGNRARRWSSSHAAPAFADPSYAVCL